MTTLVVFMSYYDIGNETVQEKPKCGRLVMYSASWCGACKRARRDLRENGIRFREYFVDRDANMNARFELKAKEAGVTIAYPRFEVNGTLLAKNFTAQYMDEKYNLCK